MNNLDVYLDLNRALARTDLRVAYDYSDSDYAFPFSGPPIQPDPTIDTVVECALEAARNGDERFC